MSIQYNTLLTPNITSVRFRLMSGNVSLHPLTPCIRAARLRKDSPPMTTPASAPNAGRLLTPGEVATIFRVDPKTVTRWAKNGRISSIRRAWACLRPR